MNSIWDRFGTTHEVLLTASLSQQGYFPGDTVYGVALVFLGEEFSSKKSSCRATSLMVSINGSQTYSNGFPGPKSGKYRQEVYLFPPNPELPLPSDDHSILSVQKAIFQFQHSSRSSPPAQSQKSVDPPPSPMHDGDLSALFINPTKDPQAYQQAFAETASILQASGTYLFPFRIPLPVSMFWSEELIVPVFPKFTIRNKYYVELRLTFSNGEIARSDPFPFLIQPLPIPLVRWNSAKNSETLLMPNEAVSSDLKLESTVRHYEDEENTKSVLYSTNDIPQNASFPSRSRGEHHRHRRHKNSASDKHASSDGVRETEISYPQKLREIPNLPLAEEHDNGVAPRRRRRHRKIHDESSQNESTSVRFHDPSQIDGVTSYASCSQAASSSFEPPPLIPLVDKGRRLKRASSFDLTDYTWSIPQKREVDLGMDKEAASHHSKTHINTPTVEPASTVPWSKNYPLIYRPTFGEKKESSLTVHLSSIVLIPGGPPLRVELDWTRTGERKPLVFSKIKAVLNLVCSCECPGTEIFSFILSEGGMEESTGSSHDSGDLTAEKEAAEGHRSFTLHVPKDVPLSFSAPNWLVKVRVVLSLTVRSMIKNKVFSIKIPVLFVAGIDARADISNSRRLSCWTNNFLGVNSKHKKKDKKEASEAAPSDIFQAQRRVAIAPSTYMDDSMFAVQQEMTQAGNSLKSASYLSLSPNKDGERSSSSYGHDEKKWSRKKHTKKSSKHRSKKAFSSTDESYSTLTRIITTDSPGVVLFIPTANPSAESTKEVDDLNPFQ